MEAAFGEVLGADQRNEATTEPILLVRGAGRVRLGSRLTLIAG